MVFNLKEKFRNKEAVVCVVGLGYVGLPLAETFSKHLRVIGYDVKYPIRRNIEIVWECLRK